MSKALMIKGANFSDNKVETITISEAIPCTGLELSQDTITFTTLTPVTLTATPTPADTTDNVIWETSDASVATVVDGVVTCVGLGTATITAYCGTQTAECAVTCASISYSLKSKYGYSAGLRFGGSIDIAQGKTFCSVNTTTPYGTLFYSNDNLTDGYKVFYGDDYTQFGIPIIPGAESITFTCSNAEMYMMTAVFDSHVKANDRPSGSSAWSSAAVANKNATGTGTINLSGINADTYAASMFKTSNPSATDLDADITVTFS